ncbi:MAG TPA: hypothetical protein VLT62_03045 [Candidatus Methylomirabilis sp.]|nr:hypothetical protein [Candidatus Methylomirabilis sp.]
MAWQGTEKFALGIFTVLEKSPGRSGVYALFSGERWVYIGSSDNIQVHLLNHLNGPDPCVLQNDVTSFAYEAIPAESRLVRQQDLIREFKPVCNGREESAASVRQTIALAPSAGK